MEKFFNYVVPGIVIAGFLILAPGVSFSETLSNGDFIPRGDRKTGADIIDKELFEEVTITIENGVVTGEGEISLSEDEPGYTHTGTASVTLEGEYNEETGLLTGTFSKKQDYIFEHASNVMSTEGSTKIFFDGTFTSSWGEDNELTLLFTGTKRRVFKSEHTNGTIVDRDDSIDWSDSVVFDGSSLIGEEATELEGEIEEETSDYDEQEELVNEEEVMEIFEKETSLLLEMRTVQKAIGDISIAEKDEEASLLKMISRTMLKIIPTEEEVYGDLSSEWKQLEEDKLLEPGTLIQTETDTAVIKYDDGSKMILEEQTKMEMTDSGSYLEKGSVYYEVEKLEAPLEIETSQLQLKVLGTAFSVNTDGDVTTVKLVEGSLEVVPFGETESVILVPGESIRVADAGVESTTSFDAVAEMAAWEQVEAETPDTVTSDVDEPVVLTLVVALGVFLVLIAGVVFLVWLIRRRQKGVIEVPTPPVTQ